MCLNRTLLFKSFIFSVACAASSLITAAEESSLVTVQPELPGLDSGSLFQVFFSLLAVVLCIVVISVLVKKMQIITGRANTDMTVISSLALSNREKLVLVQVGKEQIVVGSSTGNIRKIHVLKEPVELIAPKQGNGFSENTFGKVLEKISTKEKS